ncbi:DUF2637 domain-containing protein [Mycobacterium sp.]|uniref:DUF2637 domain-containing protein n=1 Tax=Mycobacterium sp. TaxID=1785 RepID=UPI00260AEEAB|nr:DUF2637 domain-containing protein [Mycobacterium sp.]
MTTETPEKPAAKPRLRDALRDNGLATFAMFLVVAVAVAGWAASFIALHAFAQQHMGLTERAAWLVPSTFDGAALALSLLSFRAAIYGRASLGSLLYVDGFTALSSWINWIHINDPQGKFVSALLPIAAVLAFGKVLREAREAYERRHGKVVFKVRTGLLMLRWTVDRKGTRAAIRNEILAIPVQALVGLGADTLARKAAEMLAEKVANDTPTTPADNGAPVASPAAKNVPTTTTANPAASTTTATTDNDTVAKTTTPSDIDNPAPVDNRQNDKAPVAKTKPAAKTAGDDNANADEIHAAAMLPIYRQILATTGKRPTAPALTEAVPGIGSPSRAKQIREIVEDRWHPEMKPRFPLAEAIEPIAQAS